MSDFCCNDDYNANGVFDAVDKDIYSVFITECLTSSDGCPTTVEQILQVWQKAVDNQQVAELQGTIDHLPSFDCADFNLNGNFDAVDKDIYDVFVTECLTSSDGCPQTIQQLLNVWPKAVTNQQVAELQGEINHLPRLQSTNCKPTYELISSKPEIDEGEELTITLKTTKVPKGTIVGFSVTHPYDFANLNPTDNFFVVDKFGEATLKITPTEDYQKEGAEFFTISLVNSSLPGDEWETINTTVTIRDTSQPPTYKLEASQSFVKEGDSVTVTLTTTNVPVGTSVNYVIANSQEIGISNPLGKFIVNETGTTSVVFGSIQDNIPEETELFSVELVGSTIGGGEWEGERVEIVIIDSSTSDDDIDLGIGGPDDPTPTPSQTVTNTPTFGSGDFVSPGDTPVYELEASSLVINEGDPLTITLKTENVPVGTKVSYAMTNPIDFNKTSPLGQFEVTDDGTATIELTPVNDYKVEGTEILGLVLTGASINGDEWTDVAINITILDTSVPTPTPTQTPTPTDTPTSTPTPVPSYELIASATEVFEGDDLSITLKTENVPVGTRVGYAMTHPVDFGKTNPLGIFEITEDGTATIDLTPINDFIVEQNETLTIILISSSNQEDYWQQVEVSVVIKDVITPTPTQTQTQTPTGTQTPTPTGTQTPTPTETQTPTSTSTETPTETQTPTPTETPVPVPSYELVASSYSINEGEEVTITLVTENVEPGTHVGYAMTHPDDFTNQAPIGVFEVNQDGNSILKITPTEDYQIEGTEILTISLIESTIGGDEWRGVNVKVTIIDSSTPPTYKLEASALDVNEGDSVIVTLKTTNVPIGTEVTYALSNFEDLGLNTPLGTFVVGTDKTASVSFGPVKDYITEGEETFMLILAGSSTGRDEWKNESITITINDTSVPTPTPTDTPTPEQTPTPTPEQTPTPTPEQTPTPTPEQTPTPTPEQTPTPTPEQTPTPTPEQTPTPTPEQTPTPTPEQTPTPTPEQTPTPTPEQTPTPTPEQTPTPTPEQTPTPTPEQTPTPTETPTQPEIGCEDYDNNVPITSEISSMSYVLSFRGISIGGFEEGGRVCIDELSDDLESIICPFATDDFSIMGLITLSQKPINSIIIYMSKSGEIYSGVLTDSPEGGRSLLTKI